MKVSLRTTTISLVGFAILLATLAYFPLWSHLGELPREADWQLSMHVTEGIRRSISLFGQFPFWNPWHLGGMVAFGSPAGVFSIEVFLSLLFGTHHGLILAVWCYLAFGIVGMYGWSRSLGMERSGAFYASALFGLQGTFAMHFQVGHLVMGAFAFLPWLCWSARRMRHSIGWGVGFGVLAALLCFQSIHYMAIMSGYIFGIYFLWALWHERKNRIFLHALTGAVLIFLTLCAYRLIVTYDFSSQFPREMTDRYVFSPWLLIRGLMEPFQTPVTQPQPFPGMWNWHELGCHIGIIAVGLFFVSLFRKVCFYHVFALLAALLIWDTSSYFLPGWYLRELPLFKSLYVFPRWRFFLVFFLLTGAGFGLDYFVKKIGRRAWILVIFSIGMAFLSDFRQLRTLRWESFAEAEKSVKLHSDTIITTRDLKAHSYLTVFRGVSVPTGFDPIFGYEYMVPTSRIPAETEGYRGEVVSLEGRMKSFRWTPQRITLDLSGADIIYINQNVSDYWRYAGQMLFPKSSSVDTQKMFVFRAGGPGIYELYTRPPQHELGLGLTVFFAILLLIWIFFVTHLNVKIKEYIIQSTKGTHDEQPSACQRQ